MARLTDHIEQLEFDLARYPGDTASDLLNRRLILRKHFQTWGRERYDEGHLDGRRDAQYAWFEAERRASEDADEAGGGDR